MVHHLLVIFLTIFAATATVAVENAPASPAAPALPQRFELLSFLGLNIGTPMIGRETEPTAATTRYTFGLGGLVGIGGQYFFHPHWGVELDILFGGRVATTHVPVTSKTGSVGLNTLFFPLLARFSPAENAFSIGLGGYVALPLGSVSTTDFDTDTTTDADYTGGSPDLGLCASAATTLPIGARWGINLDLRLLYGLLNLASEAQTAAGETQRYMDFQFLVGASYRLSAF